MSAPSNGDKPAYREYTAPSRKTARCDRKPQRNIGVKQFTRPSGTLMGEGKVRPGSAFEMLGRMKKQVQKQGGERVKLSQYEVDKKTGTGGETAVDDNTNDPVVAPDTRGDTPGEGIIDTDFDETLWGEQDESVDAPKPQEARQIGNNRVLQDLRPNVTIPVPAGNNLKAKAGAWGASKLLKSAKDVVNTADHPTTNSVDSVARDAFIKQRKRRALAEENKPTAEDSFRNNYNERRGKPVVQVRKDRAPVNNPSPPRGQSPQKNRRRRKASGPVFSSEEEDVLEDDEDDEDDDDDDDEDDAPIVAKGRRSRAKPKSRPQIHDTRNKKATSSLPSKAVVDHLSDEDDDDDDDDDPIVSNNRRRRAKPASRLQTHDSQNQKATSSSPVKTVANQYPQDDEDEDEDDDIPIAQVNRRSRAKPAPPSQLNDIPTKPTAPLLPSVSKAAAEKPVQVAQDVSATLSDDAAIDQLMRLGAPPTQAQVLSHIPLVHFPVGTTASLSKATPASQPQPGPQTQRQPQSQAPPKKGVAHAPQPKRARPTTTAAPTKKDDTTPSPPHKKSRAAPKREPAKPATKREPAEPVTKREQPAKPVTKTEQPAESATKPAAKPAAADSIATAPPAKKKGVAAIAGKKGMAVKIVKKPVPKGRNKLKGYAIITDDESGSD
jgi:hypothetical protein